MKPQTNLNFDVYQSFSSRDTQQQSYKSISFRSTKDLNPVSSTSILNQDLEGVTYLDSNVDVVNPRISRKIITSNKLTKMGSGINISIVDSPTSQEN